MHLIDKYKSYILENEFEFKYFKNQINIVNYISIDLFDSNKIVIKYKEGNIVINGKKMVVSKLMNNEILVKGVILSIEIR